MRIAVCALTDLPPLHLSAAVMVRTKKLTVVERKEERAKQKLKERVERLHSPLCSMIHKKKSKRETGALATYAATRPPPKIRGPSTVQRLNALWEDALFRMALARWPATEAEEAEEEDVGRCGTCGHVIGDGGVVEDHVCVDCGHVSICACEFCFTKCCR